MNKKNIFGLCIFSIHFACSAALSDKDAQNILRNIVSDSDNKEPKIISHAQAVALFLCNYDQDHNLEEKFPQFFLDSPDFLVYFELLFGGTYSVKDNGLTETAQAAACDALKLLKKEN